MKVFVTGGTGFIGQHLVRRMAHTDHTMLCLARKSSSTTVLTDLGAHIVHGDVTDRASLREGMRGCDWVFNLANVYSWWEPDKSVYRKVNVEGTRNVMECALEAGVSKVVHVSTIGVWGKPYESPIREDTPEALFRESDYFRTKYEGDQIAWQLCLEKGLPLVVIYPCGVLGRGDTKFSGEMIRRLINRRMPARVFDNTVTTYVHVADVAEAILKAAETPGTIGEKYILGNTRLSFGEVYSLLSDISGVEKPLLHVPDSLALFNARVLTWIADKIKRPPLMGMSIDVMRELKHGCTADGSKAERELGLVYTSIRKAFEEECEWIRMSPAEHMAWAGEERRAMMRAMIDLPCEVDGVSHGRQIHAMARAIDLTQQGMYVQSDEPLEEGTEATITAVQYGTTFWVKGKVLRSMGKGMAIGFEGNVPSQIEGMLNPGQK